MRAAKVLLMAKRMGADNSGASRRSLSKASEVIFNRMLSLLAITSADLVNLAVASGSAPGKSKGGVVDPLDELFPRVEIDALLKGTTILADSKSDAWKAKKEALEALQAILDQGANKRLKPQMGKIKSFSRVLNSHPTFVSR